MEQPGKSLQQRLRWCADELVDLVLQKREQWWPKDLQLAVARRDDGDWMVVSRRTWEPELAFSISHAVGAVRARNAWDGF
jgi:hypothetical protein